jgi:hypothetical protein
VTSPPPVSKRAAAPAVVAPTAVPPAPEKRALEPPNANPSLVATSIGGGETGRGGGGRGHGRGRGGRDGNAAGRGRGASDPQTFVAEKREEQNTKPTQPSSGIMLEAPIAAREGGTDRTPAAASRANLGSNSQEPDAGKAKAKKKKKKKPQGPKPCRNGARCSSTVFQPVPPPRPAPAHPFSKRYTLVLHTLTSDDTLQRTISRPLFTYSWATSKAVCRKMARKNLKQAHTHALLSTSH